MSVSSDIEELPSYVKEWLADDWRNVCDTFGSGHVLCDIVSRRVLDRDYLAEQDVEYMCRIFGASSDVCFRALAKVSFGTIARYILGNVRSMLQQHLAGESAKQPCVEIEYANSEESGRKYFIERIDGFQTDIRLSLKDGSMLRIASKFGSEHPVIDHYRDVDAMKWLDSQSFEEFIEDRQHAELVDEIRIVTFVPMDDRGSQKYTIRNGLTQ
ncbi:hypothetical protein CYMTET_55160 [Cymbomonas tetramitiformis]|uniref:Uncharacterized protein n=1 Tax=Cymbomonas tetramitiformis TaxID=36881 RepID=A0AAE0ENN4_9CHLO|nr:hypothetical protein CYMTET_55160 [Cymbomonas tetramitiformis]|eukprot:gene131-187_t